ncbi:MAG: putative Ig domain-containing protein, partial [Verrucomicrobiae bacterium]|nr:putative Ig domain-containing protein [Verrucomicrobiae bacterium]
MVEDALPAAFWVSSLPEGLSLDSETGEIAGTPLAPARSSVRVQVDTDQGVLSQIVWIEVSEGEPPTAIQISPAEVPEGAPQGSLVGTLTATDPDVTDSHSFMLVSGSGDGDNHRFRIEGDHLEVNQAITEDHEQGATTFSVRIRATDPSFHTWEQVILLDLIDDRNEDADGDGLSEAEEEDVHLTSDLTTDSDGDGFGDRYELDAGTNPSLGTEFPEGNMIVAWGDNSEGQAETGPHPGAVFLDVSAGYRHTLGLRTDGTVEAWGRNDHGQIDVPPGLTDVVQVSAGDLHSIALLSDGSVVAWGNDEFGQGSVPAGLENVVSVSSGAYHNLALLADGTVTAWGEDGYNQCQVPSGLGGVIEVSAGGFHSLALKQDGTVVVWGRDSFNVLDVPEELSEVVGIAAGGYHNLAVLHDGSVVAWGATDKGQCDVPTGLAGVREVSAGWRFSMARLDDGGVVAWGENTAGQCNVPAEAIHAGALDAGDDHVVLVRQDAGFPGFADPSPLAAWPGDAVARSFALVHASASGYEAAGLPADLTLDPTDGTLTGTVTSGSRNAVRITSFTDVGRLVAVVWMNTADGVAPTDIQLSPAEVMENMPAASLVGILTATDPDPGDSFTYELDFSGEVPDSFRFEIDGDILRTRYDSIDFETVPNPLSIRVVVIDSGGNTFSKNLSVTLLNDRDEDTDGDGFSEAFEEDVLGSSDLDGTDLSTSDFDKDGIPGFLEHAFNLPPKTSG